MVTGMLVLEADLDFDCHVFVGEILTYTGLTYVIPVLMHAREAGAATPESLSAALFPRLGPLCQRVTALVCEALYASSDHNAASVIWFMKLYFCPGRTPGLRGGSRGFALRHGGMARVSGSNHGALVLLHATRGCFLYNYAAATARACSFSGIGIDFVLPPR